MKSISKLVYILFILVGFIFTIINLYGLTQDIRPPNMYMQDFRFKEDLKLTYAQAVQSLNKLPEESELDFNKRVTEVISSSLAHIHWNEEIDSSTFHQLVPIWENYFLYFAGKFSGLPDFEKYHFADYKRSLKRGIGICGDASMIMSQVLEKDGTQNQIISFPGHVVVETANTSGEKYTFDADFGVFIPYSVNQINQSPSLIERFYQEKGYSQKEINTLRRSYGKEFQRWNGVQHFITKKYYFETLTYWLKWPAPLFAMVLGFVLLRKQNKTI